MGFSESSAKREVHSNTSLPQETRETLNKQLTFTHKQLEKNNNQKIDKTDKPLDRLINEKRKKNQINKIRNKNGEITIDNKEIQRIMRLLSATICQQNGQLGRNGQILRKAQLFKTEPGRNRKS